MKFILLVWFYSWTFYSNVGVPANGGEFSSEYACIKAGERFVQATEEKSFHYICVSKEPK